MPSTGWRWSILPTIRGLRTVASMKWTNSTAPRAHSARASEPLVCTMAISPMGIAERITPTTGTKLKTNTTTLSKSAVLDAQQGECDVNQRGIDQRDYALGQKRLADEIAELFQAGKEIVEQESQSAVLQAAEPRTEAGKIDRDEKAEQQDRRQLCRKPQQQPDQVFGPLANLAGNEVEIRFGVMPHKCRDGVVGPPLLGQFASLELLEGSVKSCLPGRIVGSNRRA